MATVQVEITDTNDDVAEFVGLLFAANSLSCGYNGTFGVPIYAGLRFQSVTGPVSGATINSATITFNVTNINGTPNTTFYGVDADDPAVWANPGNLPSNATQTTASATGLTATGSQQVDVASIVQEIVNRAGWASGNDMAFVCEDNAGSGDNSWVAEDYQAAGTAEAVLDIDYTNPASGISMPVAFHHHARNWRKG